jgi:hypothetical protein
MEAVSDSSSLYKRIPKIISSARKKNRTKPQLPQKNLRQFQYVNNLQQKKKQDHYDHGYNIAFQTGCVPL